MPPDPTQYFLNQTQSVQQSSGVNADNVLDLVMLAKPTFLIISAVVFVHVLYIIFGFLRLQNRFDIYKDAFLRDTPPPYRGEFVTRWFLVEQRIAKAQEAEYKMAVIEADKIFDDLLQKMKLRGDNMQARLKRITPELLPSIDKVWKSHKIRNKLVHDAGYSLSYEDALSVVSNYRAALRELKILD